MDGRGAFEDRRERTAEGSLTVRTHRHRIETRGQGDAHDITDVAARVIRQSGLEAGTVVVFVTGSTAAVTTIEFEPGAIADFNALFETLAPRNADYRHHLRWGDDNGSSHVRAALLGPSLAVPFTEGRLVLGRWQQIMLIEFDTQPRERDVVVQVMGE